MMSLKPSAVQSIGLRLENHITYRWNGKDYTYQGDVELLDVEVVNGLMHKRVLAQRAHSRRSNPFTGRVLGAVSKGSGRGYRLIIYIIERDEDGRHVLGVNLRSIE
jgi:hypothetical protein